MSNQRSEIEQLNSLLGNILPGYQFAVVNFKDLKRRQVNARSMKHEQFRQLVKNIREAGKLESIPYCHKLSDGGFEIISGHHRVEGALEAGQEYGIVMYDENLSEDETKAKQIAHNALAGDDDPDTLKQIYESIRDISLKLTTGLSSQLEKAQLEKVQSAKITAPSEKLKEFVLAFTDSDIENFDQTIEECSRIKPSSEVRIAPKEYYDAFLKAMKKIKRTEHIKANSIALLKLCELAMERLQETVPRSDNMRH
jgi:hypothetical protein